VPNPKSFSTLIVSEAFSNYFRTYHLRFFLYMLHAAHLNKEENQNIVLTLLKNNHFESLII